MPKKKPAALYIPSQRHKWITYIEDGQEDDPIQVEVLVRKNLTNTELRDLQGVDPIPDGAKGTDLLDAIDTFNTAVADAIAPHITDWNMGYVDENGEAVKAEPPTERDGAYVLQFLPPRIVGQIRWDLLNRSTGLVKAKSSTPLAPVATSSGDSDSIPTGTDQETP